MKDLLHFHLSALKKAAIPATVLYLRRCAAFLLCLVLVLTFIAPVGAHAQEDGKTVRVGWYNSSYNTMDPSGRRSGYAYEY